MARPKKLGMDYFAHDCDASNDEKIEGLRALYGNDGYAFYFILLERIYRSENFELDLTNEDMKIILSRKIGVQANVFEKLLKSALNLNCFDKKAFEVRHVLTSNGIKKRSEVVVEKRMKMQKLYKKTTESNTNTSTDTIAEIHESNSADIKEDIAPKIAKETPTETKEAISKDNVATNESEIICKTNPKPIKNKSETKQEITKEIRSEISPKTISETPQEILEETTPETPQSKVKKRKAKESKEQNNLLLKKVLETKNNDKNDDDDLESKTKIIIDYFLNKSGKKAIDELDLNCAKDLLQFTDIATIKAGIDTAFNRFKPKFKADSIKTIRYCRSTITETYNLKKNGGTLNGSSGMFSSAISDEQDTITEIAQKYGVAATTGEIPDFECKL